MSKTARGGSVRKIPGNCGVFITMLGNLLACSCHCVLSGTVEDTELVEGLVLDRKASHLAGGITRVEKAKIGLIQFCISPPKTDVMLLSIYGVMMLYGQS